MQTAIAIYQPEYQPHTPEIVNPQAENDKQVMNLWLFGKADKTVKEYRRDIDSFMDSTGHKPLRFVTLADVQNYLASLDRYAPRTQGRKLAAIKSLLSFSQKIGWTPFVSVLTPPSALGL
jgi:site-specific recombinase XerD